MFFINFSVTILFEITKGYDARNYYFQPIVQPGRQFTLHMLFK